MLGWLTRLIGGDTTAPRTPAGPAAAPASPAPAPASVAPAVAAAYGLRRPLVGPGGAIAGFEIVLPPVLARRLQESGDSTASAAHHGLLLASARPVVAAGRVALLHLPAALLARAAVAAQAPAGAMLVVERLLDLDAALAADLRGRGVRLGVPADAAAAAPAPDFIALTAGAGGADALLLAAQRCRESYPGVPLVALGLAHVDEVEQVLRAGLQLAGGQIDRAAAAPVARPLNAAALRICELLNMLALDRDTAEVAAALRADVAMSYRLLRYASSPGAGLAREVESVEQAVQLLGRRELGRWLSMLLLSAAEGRQATRALQEQALAHGRLLELLAERAGDAAPQALFSVGLLSSLEVLLQVPLATALAPLRLSEPARLALLERRGPWAEPLALAAALDAADGVAVERLSMRWGGPDAVAALADAAWAWAATRGSQGALP